jgi:single-strand DNA-binding protein
MIQISASGNVGSDPKLRTVGTTQVVNFSVAVEYWKDKSTTWFKCEAWGNRAEQLSQHIKKGMKVTIFGEMHTESWNSQTGEKRTDNVVRLNDVTFFNQRHATPEGGQQPLKQDAAPAAAAPAPAPAPPENIDEEIPF